MSFVRVAVYRIKPGSAEEIFAKTTATMLPFYREQPGFIAYEGVKTGEDGVISLSTWESRLQAEEATRRSAAFVQENLSELIVSAENYVGEVGFSSRAT